MTRLPLLVYDGECSFCKLWIDYWKSLTGEKVEYVPSQEPIQSVQLIMPSGEVFSGAEAVFRSLADVPGRGWMLWMYKRIPGYAFLSELFYRVVANNRPLFYRLTLILWGRHLVRPSYNFASWLFFKLLGIVYFIAFASLFTQITGLVGSNGILPAQNFLGGLGQNDLLLEFLTLSGAILSLLLVVGVLTFPVLIILWIFYWLLFNVGQVFLSFQWDILLLEVGFLAIFLAYFRTSAAIIWLFRWLLFRLVFLSGVVKLASGDQTWRNLTALLYHYETQPLPTALAWYFHQLPDFFQTISVVGTFAIELGIVFLIFAPRRLRFFAGFSIIFLQTLILLTGNYAFFNTLTIGLCLLLFDDAFWCNFFPQNMVNKLKSFADIASKTLVYRIKQVFIAAIAVISIFIGSVYLTMPFVGYGNLPRFATGIVSAFSPLHIVNTYGLFAIMTTSRLEIVVEGSNDGETWLEYGFKYKPGDLGRRPPWVAPHQPRLDWQMWFAALGSYQQNPWFVNFVTRLLQGSPEVLRLLGHNPFPDSPPRLIRALVYDYHFTTFGTDDWWERELKGEYLPPVSLTNK